MRGNAEMTWKLSLKSLIVPWHNEWLTIWFYLSFALYFWIETILVMTRNKKFYNFIRFSSYIMV